MDYPSACVLHLDGHFAGCIYRPSEKPIIFRHGVVSKSSLAPFLFSPLIVTGKKAILLLELIMNATRRRYLSGCWMLLFLLLLARLDSTFFAQP